MTKRYRITVGNHVYDGEVGDIDETPIQVRVDDKQYTVVVPARFPQDAVEYRPNKKDEYNRIKKLGGFVSRDNRVNGILAMSRSFGDKSLKKWLILKRKVLKNQLKKAKQVQYYLKMKDNT